MTELPQSLIDAVDCALETSQTLGKRPKNRVCQIVADAAKQHLLAEIRALVKPDHIADVSKMADILDKLKKDYPYIDLQYMAGKWVVTLFTDTYENGGKSYEYTDETLAGAVRRAEETPELVERVETAVFEAMANPALPPFPMSWQELQQEKGNLAEKSIKVVRDVTKAAIQAMRGK